MVETEILVGDDVSGMLPVDIEKLRKFAQDVLGRNGITVGEVNVVFVGDRFMTELNQTYKGRSGTTDVLSFNLSNELSEGLSGEVYVSLERAKTQSEEIGAPFGEEVVRLVAHGLLHLAGHVHDTDEQYEDMMRRSDELVHEFFSGRGAH